MVRKIKINIKKDWIFLKMNHFSLLKKIKNLNFQFKILGYFKPKIYPIFYFLIVLIGKNRWWPSRHSHSFNVNLLIFICKSYIIKIHLEWILDKYSRLTTVYWEPGVIEAIYREGVMLPPPNHPPPTM